MFFLATADAEGRPTCSYKGGEPGFVRVLDPTTLAFPNYDGNGMYLSTGNVLVNPAVGMLFIDFERGHRMRLEGTASIDLDVPLMEDFLEAQFVVRVRARVVYPNCPAASTATSWPELTFVPRSDCPTPVPGGSVPTGRSTRCPARSASCSRRPRSSAADADRAQRQPSSGARWRSTESRTCTL